MMNEYKIIPITDAELLEIHGGCKNRFLHYLVVGGLAVESWIDKQIDSIVDGFNAAQGHCDKN